LTNVPPPTPEDLARDGAADLAVCAAATPGDWAVETPYRLARPLVGAPRLQREEGEASVFSALPSGAAAHVACRRRAQGQPAGREELVGLRPADAAFIALAHAALPAWVRRALAAEARVAELEAAPREVET